MDSLAYMLYDFETIAKMTALDTMPPELRDQWATGVPSDVIARHLGFPSHCNMPVPPTEQAKLNCILAFQELNDRISEAAQDAIYSEFCSIYLPITVDFFLNPPPSPEAPLEVQIELTLNNAYLTMLQGIEHIPYFAKYLRSRAPLARSNRDLTRVIAERFLEVAPLWDNYIRNPPRDRVPQQPKATASGVIKTLRILYIAFMHDKNREEIFPTALRTEVIRWCRDWFKRYPSEDLGQTSINALIIFSGGKELKKAAKSVRKKLQGWDTCGLPSCTKEKDLKACARCQTIQYCSPAHQKEHWKSPDFGHKYYCHETRY